MMKIKCWQKECEEGKKICCFDCSDKFRCEDVCDDADCRKEMKMTRTERKEKWILILSSIITAFCWWSGMQDIMNDRMLSYEQVALMAISMILMMVVLGDEDDDC